MPDEVIDAIRVRKRDGAIDLPNEKRGRKVPRIGDAERLRPVHGTLRTLHPGVGAADRCAAVSCLTRRVRCGCGATQLS
jgi:hypothetical protein